MAQKVRLGIIGAGNFTQAMLLPNFKKLADVDVVVVCNRTLESVKQVAEKFGVPEHATDYRDVLSRKDIDAVLIGTPPYFHLQGVLAALDAGKHVLCQTRIAEDSQQAMQIYEAGKKAEAKGLKTMLARTDSYVKGDLFIRHLLKTGYVGRLHQVFATRVLPNFVDSKAPLQRRQNIKNFGPINPMHIGLYWDVLAPWFGDARRVTAHHHTFTTEREETPGGARIRVELPDSVTAIAEMDSGAVVTNTQMWAGHFGSSKIEIYGEQGTIIYNAKGDEIWGAQAGEKELARLPIPPELAYEWQVESDFVKMVQGQKVEGTSTFLDGVKNMEYLEAVFKSGKEGRAVDLPRH